ncbi:MAG: ATP-binding protein [Planctomycetes bacterium]|jgi:hypothetical protein|nr:ATP-binding protein [Planctomycetota bacterium]
MKWLERSGLEDRVARALRDFPVALLQGPRQCGKTSLARRIAERRRGALFDLEDPETPLRPEAAAAVLKDLRGLVVIDEIQRQPGLFPLLRVLADRDPLPARFLILGSVSSSLSRGASESLAGRLAFVEMGGFSLEEAGAARWKTLWLRGGLPPSFLAGGDERSHSWRLNFLQSFLERDVPLLGIRVPAAALRRFWTMLAHFHGRVWNAADLGRAMSVKEDTARRYLDILAGSFLARVLPPWFENLGKRLVKAPKVYIRDPGLLHALLGLRTWPELLAHPVFGFSWEGFAMEQVLQAARAEREAWFYRTHAGAELDLLIVRGAKRFGFEFKFEDAPAPTRSMRVAIEDLRLERLWIVAPGDRAYDLDDRLSVLPLAQIAAAAKEMARP